MRRVSETRWDDRSKVAADKPATPSIELQDQTSYVLRHSL